MYTKKFYYILSWIKAEKYTFFFYTFIPFLAWPSERRTQYLYSRCSLIRGILTKKKNQTAILNNSREIDVSIFPHLFICSLTNRQYFICSYMRGIFTEKNQTPILIRDQENIVFPFVVETDEHTERRTFNYRVASLLNTLPYISTG